MCVCERDREKKSTMYVQTCAQDMCQEKLKISVSHLRDTQTLHPSPETERQKFHPRLFTYEEQEKRKSSISPAEDFVLNKEQKLKPYT